MTITNDDDDNDDDHDSEDDDDVDDNDDNDNDNRISFYCIYLYLTQLKYNSKFVIFRSDISRIIGLQRLHWSRYRYITIVLAITTAVRTLM